MSALSRHIVRDHVMAGGIVALISMFFWGWVPAILFWLGSIFIDVDHWLGFLYRTKFRFWGASSMMRFYEAVFARRNSKEFLNIDIFHTVEFVFALGVMAFAVVPVLQPVFWGVMFHLFVDWIHLTRLGVLRNRCYNLWEYATRRERMISLGLDPDRIFRQALETLES